MDENEVITLPYNFAPRKYQIPILKALDRGIKRAVWVCHRRAGKDLTIFNWVIKTLVQSRKSCFYILPTYSQSKKIIWEGMTKDGVRFLDYIPKELIEKKSEAELSIRFTNGSYLQLVGSENYDRLVGTNPSICVFSEMALQNPIGWEYMRPILAENDGVAIFISTPRAKNHFYDLYALAEKDENWFCEKLTVDDTNAISQQAIEKEKSSGMSEELVQQEFYCSFEIGVQGSYYGKAVRDMTLSGRIGHVPYDKNLLVQTCWDLGFADSMSIIFYQKRGNEILIIDYYENHGYQLAHYLDVLREKPYAYGKHFAPHDAKAHDRTGNTFVQIAREQGFNFTVLDRQFSVLEGIEKVRGAFPRFFIDKDKCDYLIRCLLQYHADFDEKSHIHKNTPCHDWSSHLCDAVRGMVQSLDFLSSSGMSKEKLDRLKQESGLINSYY